MTATRKPLPLDPDHRATLAGGDLAVMLGIDREHGPALVAVLYLAMAREDGLNLDAARLPLAEQAEHLLHVASARVEVALTPEQATAAGHDPRQSAATLAAMGLDWPALTRAIGRESMGEPDAFDRELRRQLETALTAGASA